MKNCFDEFTLQAFLDGEVSEEAMENIVSHLGICEKCNSLLEKVETENAEVFSVLDNELDVLVPTQRLWSKIEAEIEKTKISWWQRLFAFESFSLSASSVLGFACLVLAITGGFFVLFSLENSSEKTIVSTSKETVSEVVKPIVEEVSDELVESKELPSVNVEKAVVKRQRIDKIETAKEVVFSKNRPQKISFRQVTEKADRETVKRPKTLPDAGKTFENVAEEESYLRTIATLSKTVEKQKEVTLRPSARINFEKNLAIVDDSIKKMKSEIKKNPKNETAKKVLLVSYQNKIDLLNSVADKTEFMAAIR